MNPVGCKEYICFDIRLFPVSTDVPLVPKRTRGLLGVGSTSVPTCTLPRDTTDITLVSKGETSPISQMGDVQDKPRRIIPDEHHGDENVRYL